MERWRKFSKAEGEAYHEFGDVMAQLEWDFHNLFWRGRGLPAEWHEIAQERGAGPKERITLWVDKRAVKFFRATGKGWQTRLGAVVLAYVLARVAQAVKGADQMGLAESAAQCDLPEHRPDGPLAQRKVDVMFARLARMRAERDAK